jgi:hypothetical protein
MVRSLVRPFVRISFGAMLLAAVALPAHGQSGERLIRIGFSGGAALPTGDVANVTGSGLAVQGFLQVAPRGVPATLRIGALYSRLPGTDGATLTLPPTIPGSGFSAPAAPVDGTQLLGGLAQVRFELSKGSSVRPYLIGGVGAYNVRQTFASLQAGSNVDKVRMGVDGGAGFSFNFGGADAFLEARLTNLFSTTGVARELSSIRVIPISFGVVF